MLNAAVLVWLPRSGLPGICDAASCPTPSRIPRTAQQSVRCFERMAVTREGKPPQSHPDMHRYLELYRVASAVVWQMQVGATALSHECYEEIAASSGSVPFSHSGVGFSGAALGAVR
jgi:hypothetical protein